MTEKVYPTNSTIMQSQKMMLQSLACGIGIYLLHSPLRGTFKPQSHFILVSGAVQDGLNGAQRDYLDPRRLFADRRALQPKPLNALQDPPCRSKSLGNVHQQCVKK